MKSDVFDVINSCDIEGYEYMGKDWAESEVIYNIGKLGLFGDFDYIGIIHWDFNLYNRQYQTYRITENIDRIIEKYDWISFFPAKYLNINGTYDVLMDERKPNCLFVKDSGLENPISSNRFIKDILEIKDIEQGHPISLCCSFLADRNTFYGISRLISDIKETKILDKFDTERRHRYPGQFMERLIAIYSTTRNQFQFGLDHRFIGGQELNKQDPHGENY